jgi:hypothetical protein
VTDPNLEESFIVGLHELKAGRKVHIDPTGDVLQALRQQSPLISGPAINLNSPRRFEVFDDHVKHRFPQGREIK